MTENTYQQLEILTPAQDEPASCRLSTRNSAEQGNINILNFHMSHCELQKSRLPAVPNRYQGKNKKMCELLAKHTCDCELARAIEKMALVVSQARSCKRNVAMSSSLPLPTCHVQRLLRSAFALGQSKHAQQSPHGVFGDARLGPDIWS